MNSKGPCQTKPTDMLIWTSAVYLYLLAICVKFSADNILKYFFLFFPENRIRHFMQIVSIGDNLHEMSNPVFWENTGDNLHEVSNPVFWEK